MMTNTRLSRKIICVLLVFFFTFSAFSFESIKVDINTEFGLAKGEINEYVIYNPLNGVEYKESQLDWDVDFIRFLGVSADVVFYNYFYFGVAGRFGIPSASGFMQDYDWLNVEQYPKDNWLTNYSKHENYMTKYIDGTVKIGGIINLPFQIFLMPSVSLQGQEFSFDGKDGYYQYAEQIEKNHYKKWDESIPKNSLSGKVISYTQQRIFLFVGLKAYTTVVPRFCFSVEGNYSPFTKIGALDNHHLRRADFLDQPIGLGTWNVAGRIQFSFSRWCRLALNADYECVPFLTGENYSKSASSKIWYAEKNYLGGASSKIFSFSLMATMFF